MVTVREGSIHLPAGLVAAYLPGVDAVVALIRDDMLEILPVRHVAAGGCLLKLRNAAGDRVAAVPDVLRAYGLGDWRAEGLAARWCEKRGALCVPLPESAKMLVRLKND